MSRFGGETLGCHDTGDFVADEGMDVVPFRAIPEVEDDVGIEESGQAVDILFGVTAEGDGAVDS